MSVSDAEHQTRLQNQYFVDTGVGPFDALYMWNRERIRKKSEQELIKTERERRIQALETQIAELQGQLKPTRELAETCKTQIAELKKQNAELTTQNAELITQNAALKTQNAKTRQGSQIMRLDNQISKLSTDIDKLENSRLQNLCKETTFACELLQSAVQAAQQEIVDKDQKCVFLYVPTINEYIKNHALPAKDLLKTLQLQTNELGYLKDGHGLDTSLLGNNQHQVVTILLELMLLLIHDKHFKSDKPESTPNLQLYGNVMKNYYNTHASTWMQMAEAEHEVKKLLDDEKKYM
jgi:hypothetical protein